MTADNPSPVPHPPPPVTAIVAVDRNLAIGRRGGLAWHYAEDLRFFKQQTLHHIIVMGRKTFQSIGKPLPQRLNVVMTTSEGWRSKDNLLVVPDVTTVVELQKYANAAMYIIGGAQIYKAFQPYIARWLVTRIPLTVDAADTFMPQDFLNGFEVVNNIALSERLNVEEWRR